MEIRLEYKVHSPNTGKVFYDTLWDCLVQDCTRNGFFTSTFHHTADSLGEEIEAKQAIAAFAEHPWLGGTSKEI